MGMGDIEENYVIKSYFSGSRRLNNIFWAIVVSLGGFGFFLAGVASFFGTTFLFFFESNEISFIPQGLMLVFYGTIGSILGIFLILTIWWNVGSGYNEYNRKIKTVKLYRKGFPGQNREIVLTFPFDEIKSVKMILKEGINPKRQLFLCLLNNREIPLIGIEQPVTLTKIEGEALTIAKYLNVFLETG